MSVDTARMATAGLGPMHDPEQYGQDQRGNERDNEADH